MIELDGIRRRDWRSEDLIESDTAPGMCRLYYDESLESYTSGSYLLTNSKQFEECNMRFLHGVSYGYNAARTHANKCQRRLAVTACVIVSLHFDARGFDSCLCHYIVTAAISSFFVHY